MVTYRLLPSSGPQFGKEFHQDRASSVKVPVANFTLQSLRTVLRKKHEFSFVSNQWIRPTAPSVPLKLIDGEEAHVLPELRKHYVSTEFS
ncbi:hypothetical protein Tco_1232596 [Tanacetum coccineum]